MSGGLGGFAAGIVGLSFLEALASSRHATDRVGGAFEGFASLIRHLASPEVPAIPDLRPGQWATANRTPPAASPPASPSAFTPAPSRRLRVPDHRPPTTVAT